MPLKNIIGNIPINEIGKNNTTIPIQEITDMVKQYCKNNKYTNVGFTTKQLQQQFNKHNIQYTLSTKQHAKIGNLVQSFKNAIKSNKIKMTIHSYKTKYVVFCPK